MTTNKSKLEDFKGPILDDMAHTIILRDNGSYDLSDYIDPDFDGENIFFITQQNVNGTNRMVISSNTDHHLTSKKEGLNGIAHFTPKFGFVLRSSVVDDGDASGTIQLNDSTMNKMYTGRIFNFVGANNLLIYKNNTTNTTEPPICIENTTVRRRLFPVSHNTTTTTHVIAVSDVTIPFTDFTSSQSASIIPMTGEATITDGTLVEHIFINYYDPVSGTANVTRGIYSSVIIEWAGTYSINIMNKTHNGNHDSLEGNNDLINAFDVYIVPRSANSYLRSYRTLEASYNYDSFAQATPVRAPDQGGNYILRQPYDMDTLLFINKVWPDEIVDTRVNGNYVLKDSKQYTDIIFSHPYESDIGFIYDYCDANETCGNCMGNTPDSSGNCLVDPDAYDVNSDQNPLTYGPNYGTETANWNSRNKLQNQTIPLALSVGGGVFVLVMFIVYIGLMGAFINKSKTDAFINHNFDDELKTTKTVTAAMGALSGIVFVLTVVWIIMSIVEGKKTGGKRFFPATNYNRAIYNPPPGYTFVNAPSSKN